MLTRVLPLEVRHSLCKGGGWVHIGKSVTNSGYVAIIGGGSIEAKSKKKSLVTRNSTEAEVALSDVSSLATWYKSCIQLLDMGRTVNVNNKYFFIKDRIKMGELKLEYIPTVELVADVLTKPVQSERFRFLQIKLIHFEFLEPQG